MQVFDGHNDLLARLFLAGGAKAAPQYETGRPDGHLDAEKAAAGGFAGGLFAVWVPSPQEKASRVERVMRQAGYALPLSASVDQETAWRVCQEQIATLDALVAQGSIRLCQTATDIDEAMAAGTVAAVLHMEGAEAIGPDLAELDTLVAQGLRSLGPVWSRPNLFGHGVPFEFPASPDIGPGLSDAGKRLVRRCHALRVAVDLSHLNDAGFWDVAAMEAAPLIASHSNAHALSPHARNLTDKQLDAIAASGGLVGVNFATAFLRDDGRMRSQTPIDTVVDHIAYLIERMGEDCVALGSDFDGAIVPHAIGTAAGLPNLVAAMADRGFGTPLIAKVCHGNWLRVLRLVWGE
ncbi:MAG: dipeptidase [Devosiaceae bacterium]|nr:dipeptidase [Devosiaceae bacterium MH13]